MEIENNEPQEIENQARQLKSYTNFFTQSKIKTSDTRNVIFFKDPNFDIAYALNDPFYVLNSSTYEVIKKQKYIENIKLNDTSKILTFAQGNNHFMLIHNQYSIFIFPLALNLSDPRFQYDYHIETKLTFLKDNEEIIKLHFINNEVFYFII
jgi:hypothetical protein